MEISITRALAELKRLDDRIARETTNGIFVDVTVGHGQFQKVHTSHKSVEDVTRSIQGSYDSLNQLMSNRAKIKAAIVLSNASTKVRVGQREMTVAEAIEMKRSVVTLEMFRDRLKHSYGSSIRMVAQLNQQMEAAIDASLNTVFGNDKGKVDPTAFESISKPQRDQKEARLLDPKDILKQIEDLENLISEVNTELDFTLSESNARTQISVDI